ncbi:MAG: 50S ribosomal protein L3 [Thermoanaerobaculia bacterium]
MRGIIGRKIGMTHLYRDDVFTPVTVVKAGPCVVVQKKTEEKDGYNALQIGLIEPVKNNKLPKPFLKHIEKANAPVKKLMEIRYEGQPDKEVGEKLFCTMFQEKEKVTVTGVSKGKGFQGVVFRHHFRGGPASHGSMFHRAPGSIGSSSYPSRVWKGMRMAGKMGREKVTVKNLEIVKVDKNKNLIYLKGAIPGGKGSYILICESGRK